MAFLASTGACARRSTAAADAGAHAGQRIVSLSPSTTESLFAIGAGGLVVGRSRFCDYPPEAQKLPQVGGFADPNFEAILALKPDLVVGAHGPAGPQLLQRLTSFGTVGYFPETESFAQIDEMLLGLGARTGHAAEAEAVVAKLRARENAIQAAVAGRPRLRVLLVFGLEPVVVAGPQSYSNEMVERAGGTNAVREGSLYPTVGMEQIFALDPDVVVNAAIAEAHGAQRIHREATGWRELRAVKAGRVVAIADESVLRPGPRIADALALFARGLHPEAAIP